MLLLNLCFRAVIAVCLAQRGCLRLRASRRDVTHRYCRSAMSQRKRHVAPLSAQDVHLRTDTDMYTAHVHVHVHVHVHGHGHGHGHGYTGTDTRAQVHGRVYRAGVHGGVYTGVCTCL